MWLMLGYCSWHTPPNMDIRVEGQVPSGDTQSVLQKATQVYSLPLTP